MSLRALLSTLFVTLAAAASCLAQSPEAALVPNAPPEAILLPDAPQPQPYVVASSLTPPPPRREAGFFTFRKSPNNPPLRTNRQVFTSKTFLLMNGMMWASLTVDNLYTHSAREHWDSEGPALGMATLLDYIMDRFFCRAYSVAGPIYAIQHYVRDAYVGPAK